MSRLSPTILLSSVCLLFAAPAMAQADQADKKAASADTAAQAVAAEKPAQQPQQMSEQQKLEALRERLETAIRHLRSLVTPAELEQELQARKPQYRLVKLGEQVTQPTPPQPAQEQPSAPVAMERKRSRVLGDEEKKALDADVLFTVDGQPVRDEEVKAFAEYFASYRQGSPEDHKRSAIDELIKIRTAEAHFADRLADMRKQIQDIHAKATAEGADFAKLAQEFSQGPSAPRGGSLGQFGRDQMVPSFARHAFTLGVGKVSPVFPSNFGYHILRVSKKLKGKTPAEDRVEAAHILISFSKDRNVLMQLMQRAQSGASDVAVRSAEDRKMLPQIYQ